MADTDKERIEKAVLTRLQHAAIANSEAFAAETKCDHQVLDGVLRSLQSSAFVTLTTTNHTAWELTDEGKAYLASGSPEAQAWHALEKPVPMPAFDALLPKGVGKLGLAQGVKKGWIEVDKKAKPPLVTRKAASITDDTKDELSRVAKNASAVDEKTLNDLKSRKLVNKRTFSTHAVAKGASYALERKKPVTDLTDELLHSGNWATAEIKEYNFAAKGQPPGQGCLHPLLKVRQEFRSILLNMGFSEMPTNNFVESSFWNFDTLCVAQQHAARDLQDTFFLKAPANCNSVPEAYKNAVQTMHEKGGYGSIGFRYDWKMDEAKKNVLRTHTTAVSARMLFKLAEKKVFEPTKMFSIDRVFRNESLDATHLAEFHQVEGLIADRNLTLGDLIGTMQQFFAAWGIHELKFKPAYNPYTEPSMEIFAKLESGRWVEIGNSGVFRPEMLRPMGLPEDVTVIAWGLSLERPTMIKYGYKSIRQLFGHKVKLNLIRDHPICRFEN